MVVVNGCAGDSSHLGGWMSGSETHPATDCRPGVVKPFGGGSWDDVGALGFRRVFGSMSVVDGASGTQSVRCRRCMCSVVLRQGSEVCGVVLW